MTGPYLMIFDVESTGLIPKKPRSKNTTTTISSTTLPEIIPVIDERYPYITQLSFVVYDTGSHSIVRSSDSYIKIPERVVITPFITNLTGITNEICRLKGKPICDVLDDFYNAYMECNMLIAHNMDFDEQMISIEIERNRDIIVKNIPHCFGLFNKTHEKMRFMERYCTMRRSIKLCNLSMPPTKKMIIDAAAATEPITIVNKRKKFPKLSELFTTLFEGESLPKNMHNSMTDVLVCLKCFLKIQYRIEIDISTCILDL
jgi:DNA polymerase III epsilon subunit-like protein